MSYGIVNERQQTRQIIINEWFEMFVNEELYTQEDYHVFCKRMKNMSTFEIERIFKKEKNIG